jgi:hypothetical protein
MLPGCVVLLASQHQMAGKLLDEPAADAIPSAS